MSEQNEVHKVHCDRCRYLTNHTILFLIKQTEYNEDRDIWVTTAYKTIQCAGCDRISFCEISTCSEYFEIDENGDIEFLEDTSYYPVRWKYVLPIKAYSEAPDIIRNIYRETISSYNHGLYILSAIWVRGIIEAICKAMDITKWPNVDGKIVKTLDGKVNQLCKQWVLTPAQTNTLHSLRFLWNDSTHDVYRPNLDEIRIAVEIAHHILDDLYDIPEKTETLERSRKRRENKK